MYLQGIGKVVENGPAASKFPIGTRVVAVPWNTFDGDGTWQQYTAVPEDKLVCDTGTCMQYLAQQHAFIFCSLAPECVDAELLHRSADCCTRQCL